MAGKRLAIDIGGTFTDLVLVDEETGKLSLGKTSSTPGDFWRGIADGIDRMGIDLATVSMFAHGTTVGLNAFLEQKGDRVGLITTRGFRDIYEIGRHNRVDMYDLFYRKPEPLVPREYRLEVTERLDARGNVVTPLDEDDVRQAIETFKNAGIRSIAVVLIHSYANPAHEQRIGDILADEYPDAMVSLSSNLAREWREYERTSTTAINAYIMPPVGRYLTDMEQALSARSYRRPLFVNQSSGGLISVESARSKPVHTIMSGPAGGAVSSRFVGALMGFDNVIAFDMGGTSTDVSLTHQKKIKVTAESKIQRHPVMVSMIDINSIGAGGGSIAWIDSAGSLNVGPQSAGATPGPVCYGRGGTEPTVTDANLLLGRLNPEYFLGGDMGLDQDAARQQLTEKIAQPLDLDVIRAAEGIIRVINVKMSYAVRAITVERGLLPADFVMMAFGGAGPMHACAVAEEIGIPRVVVPVAPGQFSALGMLHSDVRHDFVRTYLVRFDQADLADVDRALSQMQTEATDVLAGEDIGEDRMTFSLSVDMRYVGQEYTVNVPVPSGLAKTGTDRIRRQFDELHERTYGHSSVEEPTELVNLRLTAFGSMPRADLAEIVGGDRPPADRGRRPVYFDGCGFTSVPVYERGSLLAGNTLEGPAMIEEPGATTVVPPGWDVTVTVHGNLLMSKREE